MLNTKFRGEEGGPERRDTPDSLATIIIMLTEIHLKKKKKRLFEQNIMQIKNFLIFFSALSKMMHMH